MSWLDLSRALTRIVATILFQPSPATTTCPMRGMPWAF